MMKIILFVISGILFLGPIVVWLLFSGMSCAYVTTATSCNIKWHALLDLELISFAALPWFIAAACLFIALRIGR